LFLKSSGEKSPTILHKPDPINTLDDKVI
jgi:hypothetical protein